MRAIEQLLTTYGDSHQNPVNKTIHWFCVPAIFFSIFGLVRCIPTPEFMDAYPMLNWATLLLIPILFYYLRLSFALFAGFIFYGALVAFGNEYLHTHGALYHLIASIFIFVIAWIGQFIGHEIEGKKPSFLKDLQFLLIGPAWLMHFLFKQIRIPY